jgi:polysaccharide export outer membrane protein
MKNDPVEYRFPFPMLVASACMALLAFQPLRRSAASPSPAQVVAPATASKARAQGAAGTQPTMSAEADIGAGDLLKIDIFEVPELSHDYRVHSNGQIKLPLLHQPIPAMGLTTDQLAAVISRNLQSSGLVSHPQVTVEIKQSLNRSVTVAGAVKKPRIIPVFGRITLLDAISEAGGLSENAGSIATITRGRFAQEKPSVQTPEETSDKAPSQATSVDLARLIETGDPTLNLDLFPGDRVLVKQAGVVYVIGAVNRAGGFVLTDNRGPMTILKALALAQGLKSTAVANKSLVLRRTNQLQTQVAVRLKDVLAGRAPDQPLEANDILFVPDSDSQKAIRRGAEAAVEIATGLVIWRL